MTERYTLERPLEQFEKGVTLEVTARFGDWHVDDVKLEPVDETAIGSVSLTESTLDAATASS